MSTSATRSVMSELRARIARLEGRAVHGRPTLPFGVAVIDRVLPEGGLVRGALHEIAGGGSGAVDGAAAALFVAGVAARSGGQVLWCMTRPDLFAPALAQAGLAPSRVIYVECGDEKSLLACFEEGLQHSGLGAVVGETALPSTPLPVPGVGRPRWLLELIRNRAGECADFVVEACDDQGRLALPSDLADGQDAKDTGRRRASA